MEELDEIERSTWELLQEIRESSIYLQYRRMEARLAEEPALRQEVNNYRAMNFRMQQGNYENVDVRLVAEESERLKHIPLAAEYLEAELDVCRLVQRICRTITEGLEFNAPDGIY